MKERIRAIMESKGMTQQEFSQFLEMSPASLSSIFTGRTNPTLNVVESIKKKFENINLEWLMFGHGCMFLQDENTEEGDPENPSTTLSTENISDHISNYTTPDIQYKNNNVYEGRSSSLNSGNVRGGNYIPENAHVSDMKIINNNRRKIKEIRVFYDDQTYESFVPKE